MCSTDTVGSAKLRRGYDVDIPWSRPRTSPYFRRESVAPRNIHVAPRVASPQATPKTARTRLEGAIGSHAGIGRHGKRRRPVCEPHEILIEQHGPRWSGEGGIYAGLISGNDTSIGYSFFSDPSLNN